ncbi:45 kDa calcium-binding protein [Biomphalaria glabrata]|nr:glutathione peroxidase 7-like isoform X2 [Biomphalaria glabrata]XP_013077482.2 glutathione peroxidase 7-like isoform X2 [Biomphalaria glabrata]XP_055887082.1 glutathione peroxidase 7-like isoform X2 [Biomphalaria glabrata]XP_055887083.1 glutathione peroxidase 7-like isoform X2 [Biomphalaria glabrata]XP_055887085.1 glutathione peroxidase 7-like isoform X2 [Biomphalaria glabrata]KAI8749674.1 45 kDa calcium-binding protein-like glutathione peroxidase 7-like P Cell adhesion [Biomphalaria glabra
MEIKIQSASTRTSFIAVFLVCFMHISSHANGETSRSSDIDFYTFEAYDINNERVSLEKFRGKVSLVVNVASECGYTDGHYTGLNFLQDTFKDTQLFNVLAFPCNQFGQQEPGSSEAIYNFVYERKGAKFPLFAKINVINNNVHPAWSFLINNSGHAPNWNFWKYLVDHNGQVIGAWGPHTSPEDLLDIIKLAIQNIPSVKKNSAQFSRGDEF